jgi:F420-0:gamma-glutamyl ligase
MLNEAAISRLEHILKEGPLTIVGLKYIPEIKSGDNIGKTISAAARKQHVALKSGDIVVVAQKIVSKA